jgi:hypothetical protein
MWQKNSVFPIWAVALVIAAAAPLLVRILADQIEKRVRERTEPVVAELGRLGKKRNAPSQHKEA